MPSTKICMTCHSQIWTNAKMLAPDRQSLAENKPYAGRASIRLPDYVYFDHSIHVAKGVGCTECHGPIGDMSLTWKANTLYMGWCLSCHRNPAPHLRPKDAGLQSALASHRLDPVRQGPDGQVPHPPKNLTDCGICHR